MSNVFENISNNYTLQSINLHAWIYSMQIELTTILNKAWAAFLLLIPWAKRAIDKRFEETENKVSRMADQMAEIISKQDVIVAKQDFMDQRVEDCKDSIDKLHALLIQQIKDSK